VQVSILADFLGAGTQYPILRGLQPDLYRVFMERTWRSMDQYGVTALVHPVSHFTEQGARNLRAETYRRLRRHWHFINELNLYEAGHTRPFGVHVYGPKIEQPQFIMAASLYHPDTVTRSFTHSGYGELPGLKDSN